jgi:phosphoribosylaminoimidazole-succinocarboxamide synthase
VRNIFDLGERFLFVATDRISAYDCILPTPIPDKGKVLNQLSIFWFNFLSDIIDTHYITNVFSSNFPDLESYADQLSGRSMIVKKAEVIPVECVVRGYISGSAWAEYRQQGTVNEVPMPKGLRESDPLPEPIFTPATKAESGHDENIHFDRMSEMIGRELAETLREKSLRIYRKASEYMDSKGILLADTKFEFGIHEGRVLLIDEVLTPDSSRFWPKDLYEPGRSQQSFDKQFVRDYLNTKQWDRVPPAPELPIEIIRKTREKYLEIFRIITRTSLTA